MAAPRTLCLVICRSGEPVCVLQEPPVPQATRWGYSWGRPSRPPCPLPAQSSFCKRHLTQWSCPGDLAQGMSPASPLRGGCWRVLARALLSRTPDLGAGSTASLSPLLVLLPRFDQNRDNQKLSPIKIPAGCSYGMGEHPPQGRGYGVDPKDKMPAAPVTWARCSGLSEAGAGLARAGGQGGSVAAWQLALAPPRGPSGDSPFPSQGPPDAQPGALL